MVKHISLYTQTSFLCQSFKNQTVLGHSYILRVPTLVRTLTGFTPPPEVYLGEGGRTPRQFHNASFHPHKNR